MHSFGEHLFLLPPVQEVPRLYGQTTLKPVNFFLRSGSSISLTLSRVSNVESAFDVIVFFFSLRQFVPPFRNPGSVILFLTYPAFLAALRFSQTLPTPPPPPHFSMKAYPSFRLYDQLMWTGKSVSSLGTRWGMALSLPFLLCVPCSLRHQLEVFFTRLFGP